MTALTITLRAINTVIDVMHRVSRRIVTMPIQSQAAAAPAASPAPVVVPIATNGAKLSGASA